jgi:phage FluMu protein Com
METLTLKIILAILTSSIASITFPLLKEILKSYMVSSKSITLKSKDGNDLKISLPKSYEVNEINTFIEEAMTKVNKSGGSSSGK